MEGDRRGNEWYFLISVLVTGGGNDGGEIDRWAGDRDMDTRLFGNAGWSTTESI